jgi:hypothetical protein
MLATVLVIIVCYAAELIVHRGHYGRPNILSWR